MTIFFTILFIKGGLAQSKKSLSEKTEAVKKKGGGSQLFTKSEKKKNSFYLEESEAISQLFGKLSLILQRCNAMMLSSRLQDSDFVPLEIDGIMWFFDIDCPNFS